MTRLIHFLIAMSLTGLACEAAYFYGHEKGLAEGSAKCQTTLCFAVSDGVNCAKGHFPRH